MRETICRKCRASNKTNAVVCFSCGAKLDHDEQKMLNKLQESGVFRRIATAPIRLVRWLIEKIKIVAILSLIFGLLIALFGVFLLFAPISWPETKNGGLAEDAQKELNAKLETLVKPAGTPIALEFTPDMAAAAGNTLLNAPPPADAKAAAKPAAAAPPAASGAEKAVEKAEQVLEEAEKAISGSKPVFSVMHQQDTRYVFTLSGKLYDRIPWRLVAEFEGDRAGNGKFETIHYKFGNLRVSQARFMRLARWLCRSFNPHEQLTAVLERITGGSMRLASNPEYWFTVEFTPLPETKK